jgi:NAD(P)-dependent dehydrogenase (short-subunit alcohol dehydrogenase family)
MNPTIRDWEGKRVWVIGASSGIGEATAQQLLLMGARVALSARNQAALERLAVSTSRAAVWPLDVTDHASVAQAGAAIDAMWGGIDLVIIAAGGYQPMQAQDFDLDAAKALIDLNLVGVLNCLDVVLPVLLRQGAGAVAVVSSVAGFRGLPLALAYGPAKAALINLCESLYAELHPRGIGVHLVTPGFVATPMTAQNGFAMPALISVDEAADDLIFGIERGQFHVHFPRRFTNVMRLLRLLPYRLYFWLIRKVTKT